MLFGLARRTARQIEKASLLYIVADGPLVDRVGASLVYRVVSGALNSVRADAAIGAVGVLDGAPAAERHVLGLAHEYIALAAVAEPPACHHGQRRQERRAPEGVGLAGVVAELLADGIRKVVVVPIIMAAADVYVSGTYAAKEQALATHQTVPHAPTAGAPGRATRGLNASMRPILHCEDPTLWTQLSRTGFVDCVPWQVSVTVKSMMAWPVY